MVNTEIILIRFFVAEMEKHIQSAKTRPGANWLRASASHSKIHA